MRKSRIPLPMKSALLLPLLTTRIPFSMRSQLSRKNLPRKRSFSQHFKANFRLIKRMQKLALQSSDRKLLQSLTLNRRLQRNLQITLPKELRFKKKLTFSMKSSTDTKMVFGTTIMHSRRELTITLTIRISIIKNTLREKFPRLTS